MKQNETISIHGLKVGVHLGVPPEEREQRQVIAISLTLYLNESFLGIKEDLAKTVNYYEVTQTVLQVADQRPRQLVETLIEDLFAALMSQYPLAGLTVEVRKFIIPQAEAVSLVATLTRQEWEDTQ